MLRIYKFFKIHVDELVNQLNLLILELRGCCLPTVYSSIAGLSSTDDTMQHFGHATAAFWRVFWIKMSQK